MNVLNTRNDLLEEPACLIFLESFSLDDVIEQFTSTRVLHNKEKLARSLDNLYTEGKNSKNTYLI